MPLTPSNLEELKTALRRRRDALTEEVIRDAARIRAETHSEVAGTVHDRADEAVADVAVDVNHAELQRDMTELWRIDAALERMLHGAYGACATCRGEIPLERLRAEPTATRCHDCQAREEKTGA